MTAHALLPKISPSATDSLDSSFAAINWQAPWLCHLSQLDYLSQTVENLSSQAQRSDGEDANFKDNFNHSTAIIAELLNTAITQQNKKSPSQTKPTQNNQAHALIFVSQDALPDGEAYESFIASTGNIPTRDNLHDLFNGSIWLTFPKTKALLNYHHMCQIAEQGISESRGRVRDTVTVFDENGAILVTSEPHIGKALIKFDWQASLVSPRDNWENPRQPNEDTQAAVYIFGHALLEQLIQPRKPLCAHSVVIKVAPDFFTLSLPDRLASIDNKLAEHMHQLLSQDDITPRNLSPLPILGVPHFWADNANPEFYEDSYVFRNGRRQQV
ncbi:DUF3025 domain-containing protein [Psychrobacter sp. LV10R520-6]|uniref:DUF3025 domain-containing protein n=1 Tax=Psychrobacter sp. LV10R520-6 TaxID=1415574 RepID=UPI0024C6DE46|nr:DUF3025 domain-containing protein [Psychrobacter sp. LV10R520-6]SNT70956.1 Protein of unknown function [Psychrobacter sp. LV10R520-6]